MEFTLSLPLLRSCRWKTNGIRVAVGSKAWRCYLCPTRSIEECHIVRTILPQVTVAIGIETLEAFLSACKNKVPRNSLIGVVINQIELCGCDVFNTETWLTILSISRDIGEECVCRKNKIKRCSFYFKAIIGSLTAYRCGIITARVRIITIRSVFVYINSTARSWLIDVAFLCREG